MAQFEAARTREHHGDCSGDDRVGTHARTVAPKAAGGSRNRSDAHTRQTGMATITEAPPVAVHDVALSVDQASVVLCPT